MKNNIFIYHPETGQYLDIRECLFVLADENTEITEESFIEMDEVKEVEIRSKAIKDSLRMQYLYSDPDIAI